MITSKAFWIALGERAAKTAAQTLIAVWGAQSFNVIAANWQSVLTVALGAAAMSVLTSLAGLPNVPMAPPIAAAAQRSPPGPATAPMAVYGDGRHEVHAEGERL
jgi:hypothetical protein